MAKRPNVFDQQAFEESLRRQGFLESFVSPITSDFRLFVPLALAKLGEDGLFNLAEEARGDLNLGAQQEAWRVAARYIVGWANESLTEYRARKNAP